LPSNSAIVRGLSDIERRLKVAFGRGFSVVDPFFWKFVFFRRFRIRGLEVVQAKMGIVE
jgi:hypothetical protein